MAFENVDYTSLDIPVAPFSDPARIPDFPKNKVPRHVGVIMDGNGRWAQQRGLVRTDGHQAAEPVVFDTIAGAIEAGVRYLSLYTFSLPDGVLARDHPPSCRADGRLGRESALVRSPPEAVEVGDRRA